MGEPIRIVSIEVPKETDFCRGGRSEDMLNTKGKVFKERDHIGRAGRAVESTNKLGLAVLDESEPHELVLRIAELELVQTGGLDVATDVGTQSPLAEERREELIAWALEVR